MTGEPDRTDLRARYRARAIELGALLAEARHTGRADQADVTAVVDGRGNLLDLRISADAVRGPKPQLIGPGVVEAVVRARAVAAEHAARLAEPAPDENTVEDW
ncbi:YbaB/EbfC family nucleoid-associated protein [Amycolatopsis sp. SID8362]|uniref:YbaB/EbfC family nucleoid-associated protein n=1 Tax=Amycolatopsis sp. SID8362 TaxID=2690346 RepID=UPI001371327D|nr:YbaB/EbfC family nucleoid-associated protein [Amycolatopsis sp. SID8362]NBH05479.1 YbaB/EbfC family DNA-binding protein [Amycolatopsis sp. SID8362]NED42179.1 YbaB/EbfC family nucleoid-associated protein [Amycolatopsis sp. SID8362]